MKSTQNDRHTPERQAFVKSYRSFRFCVIVGGLFAAISCFAIMFALFPMAPFVREFFRTSIGGNLGEILLGVSFPLASSPPAIIFLLWYCRRTKDPVLTCSECDCWLATAENFMSVLESSHCPNCNVRHLRHINH